jgi:hypothetical protein
MIQSITKTGWLLRKEWRIIREFRREAVVRLHFLAH